VDDVVLELWLVSYLIASETRLFLRACPWHSTPSPRVGLRV
jgi:hypothetical protein